MDVAKQLGDLLTDAAAEMGHQLQGELAEVTAYAAQRTTHLSTIVGQPGFDQALRAERDAVALKAGIGAVHSADAADARIVGIIQGVLAIGAAAIAAA